MLNDLPSLPPDKARFDARVSDLEDIDETGADTQIKRAEARMVVAER